MLIQSLNTVQIGQKIRLEVLPEEIKANLIRMGLCIGDFVECSAVIPSGPVVLKKDLIEIAIGHKQSQEIMVSFPSEESEEVQI